MTVKQMISGLLRKYLKGARLIITESYKTTLLTSTQILLTKLIFSRLVAP
jgi:hypothetical protein